MVNTKQARPNKGRLTSLPLLMVIGLLTTSCQSGQTVLETPSVPVNGVHVVAETKPPATPTATPQCTPLPEGASISAMQLSPNAVEVKLKGFQPGEKLSLVFYTEKDGITSRVEEFPVDPVDAKGGFSLREELLGQFSSGASSVMWEVQVIHTRGVACTEVTLQESPTTP